VTLKERVEALRQAPVFEGLGAGALQRVARLASEVEADRGQTLIEPGAKGAGMFVLLEGRATVDTRGKRDIVLGPGECFGELALLTPEAVRTARVRAQTAVRCLAIARSDFQGLLAEEPRLALTLLETVATRLAERG
jgi:CRP-like cAMP-binding protein